MSISALLFVNQKGERLLERFYRDDVSRKSADSFRLKVLAKKESGQTPIILIDNFTFLYIRFYDIFIVAVTRSNANAIFQAYFGNDFREDTLKNNFTLIYELLDEVCDNGYPQVCEISVLKDYIKVGQVLNYNAGETKEFSDIITGSVDWRAPNKHHYRKNEVYIDVLEHVNLLMNHNDQPLRTDVSGKILLNVNLSGMPECKLGINDKLVIEKDQKTKGDHRSGIAIDDVTFHKCVRLGKFDSERAISFVPPDGEFELMRYRITQNVNLPFQVLPNITLVGRTRVTYQINIKSNFKSNISANNVEVIIPAPLNTAKFRLTSSIGEVKYQPENKCFFWTIADFPGNMNAILKGEVQQAASLSEKTWSRPPIRMNFNVYMFSSSGLVVRFLRITEKSGYISNKKIRYITRAGFTFFKSLFTPSGKYEIRI